MQPIGVAEDVWYDHLDFFFKFPSLHNELMMVDALADATLV
jgi:hypothetical protein